VRAATKARPRFAEHKAVFIALKLVSCGHCAQGILKEPNANAERKKMPKRFSGKTGILFLPEYQELADKSVR
jgi:hypothetical protein